MRFIYSRVLGEPGERTVHPPGLVAKGSTWYLVARVERSAADLREKLPRYYASFLASPEVMQLVQYRGWRLEEKTADAQSVRIRLRFDAEDEAIQFALSFGGQIEAIGPPELRVKVLAGAQAIVEPTDPPSPLLYNSPNDT